MEQKYDKFYFGETSLWTNSTIFEQATLKNMYKNV